MPALETVAPFHEVRIHPRTGAVVPINIGWLSPLLSTDEDWYDPEELTVSVHANFDGKYGVRLSAVPRNGSVVVLDMSNPSSPVELTQTTSTPGTGQFWVAEQAAQADYGQVNIGFGFIEVHSSMNGVLLEVHYQSVGSVLSNDVINDKITAEVTSQVASQTSPYGIVGFGFQNGTDVDHDVNIIIYRTDGTTSTITKQMDVEWVEGTNQGGMQSGQTLPASGVVKWLAISKNSDVTVVDFIGSPLTTLSAITIPTGWSRCTALETFMALTDGSSNLRTFYHDLKAGVVILTDTLALDLNVADQGTTRTTRTAVNAPPGVVALARAWGSHASDSIVKVESLVMTDVDPSFTTAALGTMRPNSLLNIHNNFPIHLNASRQYATDATAAATSLYVQIYGWLWRAI